MIKSVVLKIFQWIFNSWNDLPEEDKEKIIKKITESLESIFRSYYKASQSENKNA